MIYFNEGFELKICSRCSYKKQLQVGWHTLHCQMNEKKELLEIVFGVRYRQCISYDLQGDNSDVTNAHDVKDNSNRVKHSYLLVNRQKKTCNKKQNYLNPWGILHEGVFSNFTSWIHQFQLRFGVGVIQEKANFSAIYEISFVE